MILLSSLYIYRSPQTNQNVVGLDTAFDFMNRFKRTNIIRIESRGNCEEIHERRVGKEKIILGIAHSESVSDTSENDKSKVATQECFMIVSNGSPQTNGLSWTFKTISRFRNRDLKIHFGQITKKGIIISDKEIPELAHLELAKIQRMIEDEN